ncbi:MAG: hypothetical protein HYV40_04275 [Candidatus Levybacteria bacterium]|nr:hypothetical protein [Candidatus Levybacteria bacterium]
MDKKVRFINLLRHQEKNVLDKFLDWAFTVGRAIVIITESVALSAFAYRFVLDRQIIDLKDEIKKEQAIVQLYQTNERKFRDLQIRLATAKTLDQESGKKTTLLNDILQKAAGRMSFQSLTLTKTAVSMDGIVPSAGAIAAFTSDLRDLPNVASVSIGAITNNVATGVISVSIQASLVQQPTPGADPDQLAPAEPAPVPVEEVPVP